MDVKLKIDNLTGRTEAITLVATCFQEEQLLSAMRIVIDEKQGVFIVRYKSPGTYQDSTQFDERWFGVGDFEHMLDIWEDDLEEDEDAGCDDGENCGE